MKAEDELFGMTKEQVGAELLKMPGHKRFREFFCRVGCDGEAAGEAEDLAYRSA